MSDEPESDQSVNKRVQALTCVCHLIFHAKKSELRKHLTEMRAKIDKQLVKLEIEGG